MAQSYTTTTSMKIPVAEVFGPTLQGEGLQAGLRTLFLRLAYCDGAGDNGWCNWCDSMFAVDPKYKEHWELLTPAEILDKLQHCSVTTHNVTISGGNPAIHDLTDLMKLLRKEGFYTNVETQGTVYREWLRRADTLTVSPKPPSAGSKCNLKKLHDVISQMSYSRVVLKVVVNPEYEGDYEFARDIFRDYGFLPHKYMSVYTHPEDSPTDVINRWRVLAERVKMDGTIPDIAVLPQLHVLLWGHKRGV